MASARRYLVSSSGCRTSMEKLTSSGMTFTAPGLTSHFPSVTTADRPSRSTSRVINERISHINLSHRPTMTFTGRHGVGAEVKLPQLVLACPYFKPSQLRNASHVPSTVIGGLNTEVRARLFFNP